MEKLRRLVNQIAQTPPSERLSNLSTLQLSLIPLLSFASSLYKVALFLRHRLYYVGLFRQHRLPVPVISVGNLTWGGNGKTPMVEFLARWLADSGISPLILARGYAGGDEAKMLQRHLLGTYAKIGVGANRADTAACFLERHGYIDAHIGSCFKRCCSVQKAGSHSELDKIGAAILDDGMQGIERIGPLHVDRLDFSDHHLFQVEDMELISTRLQKLQAKFGSKPIVIVTEKDYDREPVVLKQLDPFEVLVLCSELKIVPRKGRTEDSYKMLLRQLLEAKLSGVNMT